MFVSKGLAECEVSEIERLSGSKFGNVANFYEMKLEVWAWCAWIMNVYLSVKSFITVIKISLTYFIYDQLKVVINHLKGLTLTCFAPSIVLFAPVSW